MKATRRSLLGLAGASLLVGRARAQGRTVVDSARRRVTLPDKVTRLYSAGPPASVMAYVLAPQEMVGWIRRPSPAEKEFLIPAVRDLPETGRLTGRGDTLSLERLIAAKPDLVIDFGSAAVARSTRKSSNASVRSMSPRDWVAAATWPTPRSSS